MLAYMRSEQFRNFLIILMFAIAIFATSLLMTIKHQYQIIKSDYMQNQYDKKVDIFDAISSDIELITLCQNKINNSINGLGVDEVLTIECMKYPADLDMNLTRLSELFNFNNETSQKISLIVNRKNQQVLDPQSIVLTKQVLNVLHSQLLEDEKQLCSLPPLPH